MIDDANDAAASALAVLIDAELIAPGDAPLHIDAVRSAIEGSGLASATRNELLNRLDQRATDLLNWRTH